MRKLLSLTAVALLLAASSAFAQLGTSTVTTNVHVTVAAEAALTIQTADTYLASSGTNFAPYNSTGPTNLTYFVRTTESTGSGDITQKVTTDFSPANGPSVGIPPTTGDALTYTCSSSAPGTACSGTQTASTGTDEPVVHFGAGAHSALAGNAASVATWSLTNDPVYHTGAYTAIVTFTISAT